MRIFQPPEKSTPSEALFDLILDLQREIGEPIDKRKRDLAEAIIISEGEEENLSTWGLIERFINVYRPDEVLQFLWGYAIVKQIFRRVLGTELFYRVTESIENTEEKDLPRTLVENILYILVRRCLEAKKLPYHISSEEIRDQLNIWMETKKRLPDSLPYIPQYNDLFRDAVIEVQKTRDILSIQIGEVEAKLLRESREQATTLRASQEQAIARIKGVVSGIRKEVKTHYKFIGERIAEFQRLILDEWRGQLKIDKRIDELKGLYEGFEIESYEFIAGVDSMKSSLEFRGVLQPIHYSFLAIGLAKTAELELQRKFTSVLVKLSLDRFCTNGRTFDIKRDSENGFYIKGLTIGNVLYAIKHNKETAKERRWKPGMKKDVIYEYLDTTRMHSEWSKTETITLIDNLGKLRNTIAHIEKVDEKVYDTMRSQILDGSTGLASRLRTLGMTREEELAENQRGAIQRINQVKRDNESTPEGPRY